jgi:hypothetical protein
MILIGTPVPTGVPAGTKTGEGMVYDGAAWQNVGSIQGPAGVAGAKGDAGPSAVSTDAGNYSKLGTDKLIFTPTPTIPAAGTANPLTDGTSAPGVSLKYAREDHVHPLPTLTALGAAATKHTHAASTDITGLATVATSGKYADLTDGYTLPEASAAVLGGVKVGTGLSIAAGVLSASGTTATDATTAKAGLVTLADAAAITAGTVGRIPDAAQLKGQVDPKAPKANPSFTGVVHIPLGTAAAPSLAFTGDTDTGIYEAGANSVGIAAGGVSALEVTATGTTVAGTLTAGGLKYPNTPGTKDQVLASDGAGNVAWTTVAAGTTYTLPAATPLALGGVKIADAAAVTLGAAGYVVDASQLKALADARVKLAGDTMTGPLTTTTITTNAGRSSFAPVNEPYAIGLKYNAAGLPNYIGTASTGEFQVSEAGGSSVLQVSNKGNITSPGTAHSFVAGSIARAAVAGLAEADLDSRYVNVSGDAMTGPLGVNPTAAMAAPGGHVQVVGNGFQPAMAVQGHGDTNGVGTPQFRYLRTRGTVAAPAAIQANDNLGTISFFGRLPSGTNSIPASLVVRCSETPAAGATNAKGEFSFSCYDGTALVPVMTVNGSGVTASSVTASGTVNVVALNSPSGVINVNAAILQAVTNDIGIALNLTSKGATSQATGVIYTVMPVASATSCGVRISNQGKGTGRNTGIELLDLPAGPDNYSVLSGSAAQSYFAGNVGINWLTPTANLEVDGTTKLRGTLDVTGNITSKGTAHSFAAKSIPASAIDGGLKIPNKTPAGQTAPGTAGEFAWDASYLYGCIAANQWRRIPWSDWLGNNLPGHATDPAMTTVVGVSSVATTGANIAPDVGRINIKGSTAVPANAVGIAVQYRTASGAWQDASVAKYYAGGGTAVPSFSGLSSAGWIISVLGPPPNVPYITRVAWITSVGIGTWTGDLAAATPTV